MKISMFGFSVCKRLLIVCFFGMMASALYGQVPANVIGANPLSLKWSQINTDRVQVIFPRDLESAGQRVANVVHYLWENNLKSIGQQKQKVTILLQNQTVIANGVVTVGPFRSEFNMTPPQFNYTTDWLDVLAIHEYRHVQQFGNSNRGLTKLVKAISGSWGWGGMFGLSLPRWYLEGDATGMETALSQSGRGRLPSFNMEYRSLLLNDIDYDYEKAAAGSLKDFVPNWYRLGYYMTTYARKEFGEDVWADVVSDATSYRGLFYPFGRGLKKRTGLSVKELYQNTISDLKENWKAEEKDLPASIGKKVNQLKKKTVTHYMNPQYLQDGSIVVAKSGFNLVPVYMRISPDGNEERIVEPGIIQSLLNATLSVKADKLCWSEITFDPRWVNKNFSIIRTYDIDGGLSIKKKLSARTKYFSPALSNQAKKVVAVEATENMEYSLVILNGETGSVIKKLPNPEGYFYTYPQWMEDDEHIVTVAQKAEGNGLLLIHTETGKMEWLLQPSNQQISHPYPKGEYVYFSSTYTGINNIFALKVADKSLYQVSTSTLGAFQPAISPDGTKLAFSEFDPNGYNLIEMKVEDGIWKAFNPEPFHSDAYVKVLEEQEGGSIFNKVGKESFQVQKYNKWNGILNPHSWLPLIDHPVYGARILSDNKFGTLSMEASAFYNVNEEEWSFLAAATYAELYPFINLSFLRANRSSVFYNFAPATDSTIYANTYVEEWAENRTSIGLALPINLTSGNFFNRLTLRADYQRIGLDVDGNFDAPDNSRDTLLVRNGTVNQFSFLFEEPLRNTTLNALSLRFVFRSFRRQALQHLNPRLGFNFDLGYRTTFGNDEFQSDVFLGRADLFLPGLSRNHSIVINTMYQRQDVLDNYRFSNLFIYPRGYDTVFGDRIFKVGFNYHMPLFYPDMAVGGLAFLKRVKANVFYDFARLSADSPFASTWNQYSTGVELTFDVRFLRVLEVDLGFRYSRILGDSFTPSSRNQFDFLLISITQ